MKRDKKEKSPWSFAKVGVVLAVVSPIANHFLVEMEGMGKVAIYIDYILWCVSSALIIGPWIHKMNKLVAAANGIIDSAEIMSEKFNELAIWRKNEQPQNLNITVSDLDDYLILLPLHLSMRYLKGMDVAITTNCCGSDKKAIEKLISGESDFAITDPYFLQNYKNPDLILLAPLITEAPMWWMKRPSEDKENEKICVFSYEKDRTGVSQTYTGRILTKQLKGIKSSHVAVSTTKDVVTELCAQLTKLKLDNRVETIIDSYIGSSGAKGVAGLKEDADKITAFECLLFACSENIDGQISRVAKEYFGKFDYFLVTEPDCSFIKKVFGYEASQIKPEKDSIFTGIITTRQYLRKFPVASLKMLRGLRDGILMSNILLMNKDATSIKTAFQEALETVSKNQKASLFKSALSSIESFELNESFFPNDLILLDDHHTFAPKDEYYSRMIGKYKIGKYGNALFGKRNHFGGDDLSDPNIQFIIRGLGYDC